MHAADRAWHVMCSRRAAKLLLVGLDPLIHVQVQLRKAQLLALPLLLCRIAILVTAAVIPLCAIFERCTSTVRHLLGRQPNW